MSKMNRVAGIEIFLVLIVLVLVNVSAFAFTPVYAGPITLATLVLLVTVRLRSRKTGWSSYGLVFNGRIGRTLALAVLCFAGTAVSLYLSTLLVAPFFDRPETHVSRFGDMQGNLSLYLWWVLLGWVFGGVLEEMFFRGYLLRRGEEFFGSGRLSTALAVVFQAAVFATVHFYYQGAYGALTLFAGALFIGAFFVMTGRTLWPLVLSHGVLNTLGFLGDYLGDAAI